MGAGDQGRGDQGGLNAPRKAYWRISAAREGRARRRKPREASYACPGKPFIECPSDSAFQALPTCPTAPQYCPNTCSPNRP